MTPAEPMKFPSSLLFNGKLYHQHHGEQPNMLSMVWGRNLASRDDAFRARLDVGPEWTPLPLNGKSYAVVFNEPDRRQTIPTPEERAADEARVLELSFIGDTPDLVVRPGEFQPLSLVGRCPFVRCPAGTARAVVHAYPG